MRLNESDTRAKLIDPALHDRGWLEDWIRREQTPGPLVRTGSGYEHGQGRTDYLLDIPIEDELIPIAVVEAKAEGAAPNAGMEQAKRDARLHHVPFAFATNGHLFHEADLRTGAIRGPLPMSDFPKWEELRDRWHRPGGKIAALDPRSDAAKPLWTPPREGARYYQRAARRAALEAIARGQNRILLPLATGAGKTWVAVSILRAVAMAGQLRRALFLCDRDELRNQALGALAAYFTSEAAKATTRDPATNARVIVATYQTLGIDGEDGDASFLTRHYPDHYFSHIIIDECHRSAWGKWRQVLERNPDAIQIGLTATPRDVDTGKAEDVETADDEAISANNYRYLGEPAYEYSIAQAMEDGYLAAMELEQSDVWTAGTLDRLEGVVTERLRRAGVSIKDARTGMPRQIGEMRKQYGPDLLEQDLRLPDRVSAMTEDLFSHLIASGGPHQKTLIFCASIDHANAVVEAINNLYVDWADENDKQPVEPYAFACTAEAGRELIAELRGSRCRAFIAATVDLITTGVDVPCLQNIVYFRYIQSPILFHQMLGRGTRIDEATGKRHFTVYDYTNATRLLDAPLKQRQTKQAERRTPRPSEPTDSFRVEGVEVRIEGGERRLAFSGDGKWEFLTLEEYGKRIAAALRADIVDLGEFRNRWLQPDQRGSLMRQLGERGVSMGAYRSVADRLDADGYDVLAALGWGETIRSRIDRAERIDGWIDEQGSSATILGALVNQFGVAGTDALESPHLGKVPSIIAAGGLASLQSVTILDLKRRLLATDAEWAA